MDCHKYSMANRLLNFIELCIGLMFFGSGAFYAYLFCITGKADFILLFVMFIGFFAGVGMVGKAIFCMYIWHSQQK